MAIATHYTMADIRAANSAAGLNFFDRSTLRFFRSIIGKRAYNGPGGIYFTTSEQFVDSNGVADLRRHTVRRFDPQTARIATVGDFNSLDAQDARDEAKRLASGK